jgi:hypothetical protein
MEGEPFTPRRGVVQIRLHANRKLEAETKMNFTTHVFTVCGLPVIDG